MQIKIFPTSYELAEKFAEELVSLINESAGRNNQFTVVLSGGTTPELLFSVLGDHFSKSVQWNYVQFFWGDERCVPADSSESNYGMTKRKLFDKIVIPSSNIHRIIGENDPESETIRYSEVISSNTRKRNGLPVFDLVILGLGDDGHTASLFPDRPELLVSDKICEVAVHPITHQRRITITGRVLNNAEAIVFLATGIKKAAVIETLFKKDLSAQNLPAYYIVPVNGNLTWYIDKEAGAFL
jgi:6-phosphogluconolactonase